jgi:hypothetical protein
MKTLIFGIFFLCVSQVMSQDTLYFNRVIDWDEIKKRSYNYEGYWVYTDTSLCKVEGDYRVDYKIIEKKENLYRCLNSFDEEVLYFISHEVVVRNLTHPHEYTIYRKIKK